VLLFAACRGGPLLKGDADIRLSEWLAVHETSAQVEPLLDARVEAWRGDEHVTGAKAAAGLLAQVETAGKTRLLRHHDVSLIKLGEGRVLFLQRNVEDRIIKVAELRAPSVNDGIPWWGAYYDRAWNLDDDGYRMAMLKPVWGENARYVDGADDVVGAEALSGVIGRLRSVARGSRITNTTGLADAGGGWWTWDWVMTTRGINVFRGFDLIHLGPDGKIEFLAGFFDKRD
jgi:hypothetical protein